MIKILRQHLVNRLGNDINKLDEVLQYFKPFKLIRHEQLLEQGNVCEYIYFVARGSLKVYVHDTDFNETTRDIIVENNWCSELNSFSQQIPAMENIQAVEHCALLGIDYDGFQKMIQTVPQFDKIYRQIIETSYANSVSRIYTFVSLNALERIKWLMQHRPELMTRFSSRLIASYLGISQETFSRLKAKV